MGSAVWVLLALLAPGPLRGSPPRLEVRGAGDQILLPCGAPGPRLRWVWAPRYPKCAGDPGNLEIARLPPGPEPPQFRGRLDPHPSAPGALLLRDLVMSDSGTFTCHGESGPEPPVRLEVTGGPGSEWGIWVAAPAPALGLIGAGLGTWCLWRRRRGRNRRNRNKRENETGAPGPRLSPSEEPRLGAKSTERRLVPQSRERKVPGPLLYAEVQHPLVPRAPPPPPHGTTVYATIV
ncbi:megakaryocyte and platelet inhibitory receptor G6b-like isoform X3 [Mauremys mutica]|uniref:megakaryocyte and platelet inhibitory receptor G6b-like isoform X3 n=1 Tax=Mauremys mutica TaxID=74926 RepID=UPI001D165914|nr:megakaryocyte and platelet inhibitory receptor G6b-like isoform X3 [Mauremys mutica]XP_044838509.1 megakaryocyte and platelet inhibitory receptor G6b-like isoform X3 [Mauremys mutica]